MAQTLFCSCLQHPQLLAVAVLFNIMVDNLKAIVFLSLNRKNKSITWPANFSGDKSLFGTWYRRIRLTFRQHIVSPEIINMFWEEKKTLHCYSQSNDHPIHLADIYRPYLVYFQMCNVLKILRNQNCLIYCIFQCRILHLVFPYSDQY